MEDSYGKDVDITKALGGNNPLPDTYRVKVADVNCTRWQLLLKNMMKEFTVWWILLLTINPTIGYEYGL